MSKKDVSVKMERDPFRNLTASVEDASKEETAEILESLGNLSDEDLRIASAKILHSWYN